MDITSYEKRLENIRFLAKIYGWQETKLDTKACILLIQKKRKKLQIAYTKMTVISILDHPKLGRTHLIRKEVSLDLFEKLLNNPRIHTDKGYYRRKK